MGRGRRDRRLIDLTLHARGRDGEVCRLRWEWEVKVPELGTSVFIVPFARGFWVL